MEAADHLYYCVISSVLLWQGSANFMWRAARDSWMCLVCWTCTLHDFQS